MILPRRQAPNLTFPLLEGAQWSLADQKSETFTMILVYRGLHCSVCKALLGDLDQKLEEFTTRGVNVVAVSMDDEARAARTPGEWGVRNLTLGYGLSMQDAREWRLYVSSGNEKTPPQFSEPGLFLIRADGELFYAATQNSPFGRPPLDEILLAIDFAVETDYPARGDVPL
eukprot:s1_g874.t1